MDANFQLSEADKNRSQSENQKLDQTKPHQNKIELSYQAVSRLARILAEIAENSTSLKEPVKLKQNE